MTETRPTLPFLRPGPAHPAEVRLADLPVTALVGVTGVGKSTALAALQASRPSWRVLPDRRAVTDAVMIWPVAGGPVTDREERFRLSALYRAENPGGMAQALGSLWADTRHWGHAPVFDGLRGLEEVQYAARTFPAWRFVALDAPDEVRVRRLLGRADSFDRVQVGAVADLRAALGALPGVDAVFGAVALDNLAALSAQGHAPQDILAKTRIVVSERRNYDPRAAGLFLRTLPAGRALQLDTVALTPAQVAAAVRDWVTPPWTGAPQ